MTEGVDAAAAGIVNLGETAAPFALASKSPRAATQQIADETDAAENAAAP